jgi:tetratricopeptide (TPR) repeat protein
MKVTGLSFRALVVGAAVAAIASFAPCNVALAQAKGQQPSPKLQKPLHDAQEDLNNKKYTDAIAKLKEAEAMPDKKPYDQHVINDFLGFAYAKTGNYAEAAKAWEPELDDGFTSAADIQTKTKQLTQINYQLKNYDKAIEFGNRAIKGGFADEQIRTIVGQSYYLKGDWKGTLKFENDMADSEIKAGQTPKQETLELILSSCVKLSDNACVNRALERMVTYYPKPDYWYQLLYTERQAVSGNDADTLQVYRLMFEVDVLKNADDYSEMASLAMDAGSPGEARTVLERGFSKNVFTEQRVKDREQRMLDKAKQSSTSDQATLPKLQAEADAASTGAKNVGVGLAYYGYGQYDKAIDELTKGLSKGGLKSQEQAQLLLGIAQLKGGHKDDAIKTFKSVKGDDQNLDRLANLWVLHAKQAQ